MTDTPKVSISMRDVRWKGKPLSEHTPEELIEIIYQLLAELHEMKSPERMRAHALGRAEMIKRGEA